jgi:hypothetical protein
MIALEALNALYGDCILLRYPGTDGKERLWIVDGGPKGETVDGAPFAAWRDALLPRLKQISQTTPLPITLGMVSHIDDDHIFGIQKVTNALVSATPANPAPVKFARFWFNSFEGIVGPKPAGMPSDAAQASLQSLVSDVMPQVDDHHAELVMESIPQGNALASDLRTLGLNGNSPVNGLVVAKKGQKAFDIEGAKVTVIGPLQNRLDKLRDAWAKALSKPDKAARQAAMQELFLPAKSLDKSVPNLSSIVVLVEVGGKKLLLTGDAFGNDVVSAWDELGLGAGPVKLDLLKMPHHGSNRNCTKKFLEFFEADNYVFSANGKFDNPDPETVEATVKLQGHRKIVLHFTNKDLVWPNKSPYKLDKGGAKAKNLTELIDALHKAYGGPWTANFRAPADKSVVVKLA